MGFLRLWLRQIITFFFSYFHPLGEHRNAFLLWSSGNVFIFISARGWEDNDWIVFFRFVVFVSLPACVKHFVPTDKIQWRRHLIHKTENCLNLSVFLDLFFFFLSLSFRLYSYCVVFAETEEADRTACTNTPSSSSFKVQQFKSINLKRKPLFWLPEKKHLRCRIGPAPTMMSPYVIIALTVAVTSYSGAQYFLEGNLVIYLPAGPFRLNYSRKNKRLITLGDSALPPDHPASLRRSLSVSIQAASLAWMLDERWLGGGAPSKAPRKNNTDVFSVHDVPLLVFSFCRPQSKSITTICCCNHRASNQNVNASRERGLLEMQSLVRGLTYQSVLLLMTENPSHPRPSFSSFPSVLKCRRARYIEIQEVIWQRWWGLQQPKGSPQVKAFSFPFFFFCFLQRHVWLSFNEHSSFSPSVWETKPRHQWEIDSEDVFCLTVCVCLCVFSRVVGPAVTFKVSPNTQNVSTADVANVAGRCSSAE